MLTRYNPPHTHTHTQYKSVFACIEMHTHTSHTHSHTLTQTHSQTTESHTCTQVKHRHPFAQKHIHHITCTQHRKLAQTYSDEHLQVYDIKHRHIHTQVSFLCHQLKAHRAIRSYRHTHTKHASEDTHELTRIVTTGTQCSSIKYTCSLY